MKRKITYILLTVIILISIILGALAYPLLPDEIETHWNQEGIVDGYSSKFTGVFSIPLILIFLLLLYIAIPILDPLKRNIIKFKLQFDAFIIIIFIFLLYIMSLLLLQNLGYIFNLSKLMIPAFGILIYSTGILLKKSKRNWFIGIKTPWTLQNDIVWEKTHKIGGGLFKLSGFLIILSLFFFKYSYFILFSSIVLSTIISTVFSFIIYNKLKRK